MGWHIRVRGLVQGVGFRPFVWQLATEMALHGDVCNDGEGVLIRIADENYGDFAARLASMPPRLARVDAIEVVSAFVESSPFSIRDSVASRVHTAIGPDAAICPDCVAEIFEPLNRRYRYGFTTCTHCGPRYTVSRSIPYDRARTSLSMFPLCPECAQEYSNVGDRRFHAETTCCPECGPRLSLVSRSGDVIAGDPIALAVEHLLAGRIVAIKGIGGFHLACDARNPGAIAELRRRKNREEKPFAVMALNADSLRPWVQVGTAERRCLESFQAPIVLCKRAQQELPGIAPGLEHLGVMLPGNPVQLLLWHQFAGQPSGCEWLERTCDMLLVMSSANPSGEPLVVSNAQALLKLDSLADAFLLHDRDIVVRCDDSVVRASPPAVVRRARGFVPVPILVPGNGPVVLALGGHQKNTVCLLTDKRAFLSQHIGGLENAAAVEFQEEVVAHLMAVLDAHPALIVHDMHPDYASTKLAHRLSLQWSVATLAVQHHHAHIASVCAERGVSQPVLGLAIDGVGLGLDGSMWGGELLCVRGARFERLGHMRTLPLPGGDKAAREPWRMAVAALIEMQCESHVAEFMTQHHPLCDARLIVRMVTAGVRCPRSSSLGRWFDAAAGLLGVRSHCRFEGQAAMELEALALRHGPVPALSEGFTLDDGVLDLLPLLRVLVRSGCASWGAAVFHATLALALSEWVVEAAHATGIRQVVVAGGCAMNAVLMETLHGHLRAANIDMLQAVQVPANDGGLALGQAWVGQTNMQRLD